MNAPAVAIQPGMLPVQIEFIIAPNGEVSLTMLDEDIVRILHTINPEFKIPVTEAANDYR